MVPSAKSLDSGTRRAASVPSPKVSAMSPPQPASAAQCAQGI